MLRFPRGADACRDNILQQPNYLVVIVVLLPTIMLPGFTMSPKLVAVWPWLLDLFGGRQSARWVHFFTAGLLIVFLVLHLLMVLAAGPGTRGDP